MAGRRKGTVKTGGRKKGTTNKDKQELRDRIRSKYPDYCPVEAMCKIAQDPLTEIAYQVQCNKEVAQYIYPKLKSIDHNHGGQEGNPIKASLEVKFI